MTAAICSSAQTIKAGTKYCVSKFGQNEYAILLKDIPDNVKKALTEDEKVRTAQAENLRNLFVLACSAEKQGLAAETTNAAELENIRSEIIAFKYDKELGSSKTAPAFSRITESQISEFYKNAANFAAFERFVDTKIALLKRSGSADADRKITDQEKEQAKEFFAKIAITRDQYLKAERGLDPKVRLDVTLATHLQQAQFLSREISTKIAPSISAKDDDITRHISDHPEFDVVKKKASAAQILTRAKAGEDFATLANQYSEDPGNGGSVGNGKNGGAYKDVPKGRMIAAFENAALSLKPGDVYPELVESQFGYHIIRLDNKTGDGPALKYDVRHILISTQYKDPDDPRSNEQPLRDYVRAKLEKQTEKAIIDSLLAANPVDVAVVDVPLPTEIKTVTVKKRPLKKRTPVRKRN